MRWSKVILWVAAVLVGILLVIQYINAAKYEALVQVIDEDLVGGNPTGERLAFGGLHPAQSAGGMVTLKSEGDTGAYVIVWMRGELGNLMNVNKNFFTLEPKTEEKLEFSVYIPNSAEFKYYYGKVVIFQIPKIW